MMYIALIAGLIVLVVGGDFLVRGGVALADRLGVPHLIIGLTIIAFGTSAPELIISLKAAFEGAGGIALGNVIGSNIANILLVLGLPSLIAFTDCSGKGTMKSYLFMLFVSLVFVALIFGGVLGHSGGLILLAFLALYLGWNFYEAKKYRRACDNDDNDPLDDVGSVPKSLWIAILSLIGGLIALPIGASLTVESAVKIARAWHVSEAAIGLTIIAIGTSLPELVTTITAALKRHTEMAVGNAIGSNIFNILAILGITATLVPIGVPPQLLTFDVWIMLAASLFLFPFVRFCWPIGRVVGGTMVVVYAGYIFVVYAISQGMM